MDPWVPILAAAVGAIASLLGVAVSQVVQGWRDSKSDKRGLRDARAARLREGYVRLLQATRAVRYLVSELTVTWEGEEPAPRSARLDAVMQRDLVNIDEAVTRLMLERDTKAILDEANAVLTGFYEFRRGLWLNRQQPGSANLSEIEKKIEAASLRLLKVAQEQLDKLERPI